MIYCGKEPSNQMQLELPGYTSEGAELMQSVRQWASDHYAAFQWFKQEAAERSAKGEVSPKLMAELMRDRFHVSIPNAYVPGLARVAMEQRNDIRFRLAASKVDGFTEVKI